LEHLAKATGDEGVCTYCWTEALTSPQRHHDNLLQSTHVQELTTQHSGANHTPPLLICTVRRLQSTPPPKQAVSTPYRWELVSSQVLLVPSPQCTTCAGRKKIRSKLSQVRSQALLSHTLVLGKHWLTRLPCTHTVKQLQTHSIFCPNMHSINALHIFRASHTEYTLYN